MSLEAVIQENTNVMRELIAALVRPAYTQPAVDTAVKREPKPAPVKSDVQEAPPPAPTQAPLDYEALKKKFLAMVKEKGNECAPAILAKFGVDNLKKVPPEQYGEVFKAIEQEMQS